MLRATAYLAEQTARERPTPVAEIAEALGVPRNYLSKILHQLAQRGVLRSERGPHGGFRLATPPAELKLIAIVEPVEPQFTQRQCLLGRPVCSDESPCAAHTHWQELSEAVAHFLEETTVADLTRHG